MFNIRWWKRSVNSGFIDEYFCDHLCSTNFCLFLCRLAKFGVWFPREGIFMYAGMPKGWQEMYIVLCIPLSRSRYIILFLWHSCLFMLGYCNVFGHGGLSLLPVTHAWQFHYAIRKAAPFFSLTWILGAIFCDSNCFQHWYRTMDKLHSLCFGSYINL